jgi:hypothetical protein
LNKYLSLFLKVILWIFAGIITLFLLIVVLIQVPAIQNIVKNEAVSYLEEKIKTPVRIAKLEIGLPKKIVLRGVYFQSQDKDTLLAGDKLAVDISLFKLLDNKLEINSIDLEGITAHVKRNQDSVFNFDYIIKAFAAQQVKEPKPQDTNATMKFSIAKINLDKINVKFDDAVTKNNLKVYLHHFDTKIKKFDLDSLDFDIPKITLDGLNLNLKQGIVEELVKNTQETVEAAANTPSLKLKLKEIDFSAIKINYNNESSSLKTFLDLGKLNVIFNTLNLQEQLINIEKIVLKQTKGSLALGKISTKQATVTTKKGPQPGWKIGLQEVAIAQVDFKFDDFNSKPLKRGIDYMHLDLKGLLLNADEIYYSTDTISGKIASLKVADKSGLNIQDFRTSFFYGPKYAYLEYLYIKTPRSLIRDEIKIAYPSIASLSKNLNELYLEASLNKSSIAYADVLLFAPDLAQNPPFKGNPNAILRVNSIVKGRLDNLNIPKLELSGIGQTNIVANGRIKRLPNVEKAFFDLNIKEFSTNAKDINSFIPKGTLPANIQIPERLSLNGFFKGAINNFNTQLFLKSSSGDAHVKANYDQRLKNRERYQATVEVKNFHVGQLIKNDSIGRISLNAQISGLGLNPKTMVAGVKAQVLKAQYNGYTYNNLDVKGNIKVGVYQATAKMDDKNLDFDLIAKGSFNQQYPSLSLKTNIDSANFGALNLYKGSLKFRGKIDADIATLDPDYLNGKISINNMLVATETERFPLDSINIISKASVSQNSLDIKSPFLNGSIKGKYQFTQLATALSNTIAKYYDTSQGVEKEPVKPQYFAYQLSVQNHPALIAFVPGLTRIEPIQINGRYNSEGDTILMKANIPKVIYGSNIITNAVLNIEPRNDSLAYSFIIDEVKSSQFLLPYTALSGNIANNIINYRLQVKDIQDKERYLIAGTMQAIKNDTEFKLALEGLKLNYERWQINENNLLSFGERGIYANNFELRNQSQSIKIQSEARVLNAPMTVTFDNFKIETLTSIIEKDSLLIGGTLDGEVLLKDLDRDFSFTSDLAIQNFNFRTDTLGNISLKVNNQQANTFAAQVAITGQGNDVKLDGLYRTNNGSFDMDLDISKLNLKSIEGFTFGNLKESSGYLTGDFKISGTATAPKVIGDLQFNNGAFRVAPLNSYFQLLNDKISFTPEGINFNRFSLSDSANNKLTVNGAIYTSNYQDYRFNIDVNANNFKAVSSTAKDNELYYGDLFLNTRLRIRGDLNQPEIEGILKINKDTRFTIVLPQSDPGIADREGIVEFIDQDNPQLAETFALPDSLNKSSVTGMDVSMNIEVDPEAELTMIIDKGNGDFVKLKGEAELTGGMDPSGKISLTGKYELKEGSYEMSFNFIRRVFKIKEGSSLVWTGEPTTANIDITAIYETETAPLNLLDNQLGGRSVAVRNTYKQEIPFQVLLNMDGELLKPEISFDIVLPEGNYNVSQDIISESRTRLEQLRQQPSELNKQVFALLLLNRFVGENPFASEAGSGGVESIARQSVSKILSQQLNNLAGDLLGGVELNFDLEATDDYTTGQRENRTDLNVGLSKRLLNDRLKVTIGSNFGLEGPQQANRQTNNIAGDIAADYQLSKDGRYLLRAYRKNQYQMAIQGQVIETGLGFILTMDYNQFKEIFEKPKSPRRRNNSK